jgi:hypothetical protein
MPQTTPVASSCATTKPPRAIFDIALLHALSESGQFVSDAASISRRFARYACNGRGNETSVGGLI